MCPIVPNSPPIHGDGATADPPGVRAWVPGEDEVICHRRRTAVLPDGRVTSIDVAVVTRDAAERFGWDVDDEWWTSPLAGPWVLCVKIVG